MESLCVQPELIGHAVLVEDVGHALYFACGRGEKGHPVAGFHQVASLGDGHLHVAVEAMQPRGG